MARPCKTMSEGFLRGRVTIGSWAPQANSLRRNWRVLWLSLLATSKLAARETVVGEARVALSCAERAGEFGMSIADDWRHLGAGSAVLHEIERKAAADGIEFLFGDTLRTNEAMIRLALSRGFRLEPGLEPRLVRIRKRLDDAAPDLPCRKWSEIADGVEHRTA